MEDRIIVRESAADLRLYIIEMLILNGLFIFLSVWGVLKGEDFWLFFWIDFLVLCATIPGLIYYLLRFFLRRLELGYQGCSYRNMFGGRQGFMPEDVAAVKVIPSVKGCFDIFLLGQDGETLFKAGDRMTNYDKIIPFFETYNASAVWTEAGWIHPKPVLINEYGEELVVKPTRRAVRGEVFSLLFSGCLMCVVVGVCSYADRESVGLLHYVLWLCALGVAAVMLKGSVKLIRAGHFLCLVLTTGSCTYTDEKGTVRQFTFDEIGEIQIKHEGGGRSARNILELSLLGGRESIRMSYMSGIEHVTEIIPFVEYHRKLHGKI